MLNVGVMVSGGGTNLQAVIDAIESGAITNAKIRAVISNNPGAYALERAKKHGIEAVCVSPKSFKSREEFHGALLEKVDSYELDLIVLAGFLVRIPPQMVAASKSDHQHPPVADPVFLRGRVLWAESS